MDDLIYRNNAIAEENIDPHGRPAKDEFEEFSEEVSEHTDLGYKNQKVKSAKERKKRLEEMDEIVKEDLKYIPQPLLYASEFPYYHICQQIP